MQTATCTPIASRFAWKEYRVLRGFWLAVAGLGVLVQWASYAFGPSTTDRATAFFSIALGTAALYAVGVAATAFSVEHEEETYNYIECLPTRWLPVFAGKLLFAAASAFSLAVALSLTGWMLCGFDLPSRGNALLALGVFGFAIVEAIAWGTFFSLLLRQPLLAALLAIAAQSLSLTWATSTFGEGTLPSLSIGSYLSVLPVRVAIVMCVAAIDVLLARRWLTAGNPPAGGRTPTSNQGEPPATAIRHWRRFVARAGVTASSYFNARVLSHLLWQTWQQSQRLMLAMPGIAVFLCVALYVATDFGRLWDRYDNQDIALMPFVIAVMATALYASVVFYADQRGHKYCFLAEHAAWPRFVWFSRLAVWLLPIVVTLVIAVCLLASSGHDWLKHWLDQFKRFFLYNSYFGWELQIMVERWRSVDLLLRGLFLTLWGMLAGFSLGQACSMFFRRALVAGFAAAVLAIPLLLWGLAVWAWELPAANFLLPIAIGLLAATWLRVPDWIVDRNSLRAWLKVAAALALPLLYIAWQLPAARGLPAPADQEALLRIADSVGRRAFPHGEYEPVNVPAIVSEWMTNYRAGITPEARTNADRLIRLGELIETPIRPPRTEIDEKPYNWIAYRRSRAEKNRAIIDEATRLVGRDYCFPSLSQLDPNTPNPTYDRLTDLVDLLSDAGVVATRDGNLDAALKYHLAALQLWERLWSGQSTNLVPAWWSRQQLQDKLVDWAFTKGQTTSRIKQAIAAIDRIYPAVGEAWSIEQFWTQGMSTMSTWPPPPELMMDYLALRRILLGEEPSNLLARNAGSAEYAAILVNELPFERERALRILDFWLVDKTAQWYSVLPQLNQKRLQRWARDIIQKGSEGGISDMGDALRNRINRAYSLSYDRGETIARDTYPPYSWLRTTILLRKELERMGSFGRWLESFVDTQVAGWGLRQQLALVAYRLDHGEYPDEIAALAPDYLPFAPIDPYSGRPFEYRSQGLPLEFRGYHGSGSRLESHTPFLWSVGARDAQLRLRIVYEAVDPNAEPSDESAEVRREVYVLETPPTSWWYYGTPLVFPLPK